MECREASLASGPLIEGDECDVIGYKRAEFWRPFYVYADFFNTVKITGNSDCMTSFKKNFEFSENQICTKTICEDDTVTQIVSKH